MVLVPARNTAILFPAVALALCNTFSFDGPRFIVSADQDESGSSFEEAQGFIRTKKTNASSAVETAEVLDCTRSSFEPGLLEKPCELDETGGPAPAEFSLIFPTQYGDFTADCVRERAPVWADRVYKLAKHGYYNGNYFFRVIPGRYIQFGTSGDPAVSNVYNYTSTTDPECSVLRPQPPDMPYCLASSSSSHPHDCTGVPALSNDFGTLAMSTSYKQGVPGYPDGVTWNATAELFINIGQNHFLDSNLFIPICTIDPVAMEEVVLRFPSFGEVSELGGNGPSLGLLYQDGNPYIESNPEWNASMAVTSIVSICTAPDIPTKGEMEAKSDRASARSIGTNHGRSRLSWIASIAWKGVAVWLISLIVLN